MSDPAFVGTATLDQALEHAEAILRAAGVDARRVTRAGADGDVLAVAANPAELAGIRGCAEALRALGFRFVALELGSSEVSEGGLEGEGPSRARSGHRGVSGEPATRLT
ncbi:MAG TPA: hypothetical protein VK837_13230 [Longimicrobiales bacterium]|nr:hypothetical protein [Longimicrobiales bacterium]